LSTPTKAHDHDHEGHDHKGHDHDHEGHDHDHEGHDHDHGHESSRGAKGAFTPKEAKQARRLSMVLAIVSTFLVFEFTGAVIARSNVLQADALHLFMDVLALAMSLVAMRIAVRRPTPRFTFGLRRAEPVAAMFNAILVLFATFEIVERAIAALRDDAKPEPSIMLVVAIGALVVNGISAWLLHDVIGHDHGSHAGHDHGNDKHDHAHQGHDHGHTLNLRGARLHLIGDTLGSVAALVAAIVVRAGGPSAADPIASFLVAIIIGVGAVRLLRDALMVLLEAAPIHLPVHAIRKAIQRYPGVAEVHDMHVWTLGAGHDAIVVHIHADGTEPHLVSKLARHLRNTYKVEYVTVQVEQPTEACDAPPSLFREEES
jgi:cobalt-zinc-cadmium efflux system protein